MARRVLRIIAWMAGIVAVIAVAFWLFLAAPFFSGVRVSLVQDALSKQIGQPLLIEDDVRVVLGLRTAKLYTGAAVLPSETIPDMELARLDRLELDIDIPEFLSGVIDLDNIEMENLHVRLLRREDGATSWSALPEKDPAEDEAELAESSVETEETVMGFLRRKAVRVKNLKVEFISEVSGFEFRFVLDELLQDQVEEEESTVLTARGSVNGESFEISGEYPLSGEFRARSTFGGAVLEIDGDEMSYIDPDAWWMDLTLDTGEVGDFLELIGLQRSLEGEGKITARLTRMPGKLSVDAVGVRFDFAEGQTATLDGKIGNVFGMQDMDVTVNLDIYPEDSMPAEAEKLADLRLTGLDAHIVSRADGAEFESLNLSTNSFGSEIERVGPVRARRVFRTEDGRLEVQGLTVHAGPEGAPLITAEGRIGDLLKLRQIDLQGELDIPAAVLFTTLPSVDGAALGKLSGDFAVGDTDGGIALQKLTTRSEDTDLWNLKTEASVSGLSDVVKSKVHMTFDVLDAAGLLRAFGLKEVTSGAFELGVDVISKGAEIDSSFLVSMDASELGLVVNTNVVEGQTTVRGELASERIDIGDLRDVTAAAIQFGKLEKGSGEAEEAEADGPEEPEEQPFILPPEEKEEQKAKDLLDAAQFLRDLDLEIAIRIKELFGPKGRADIDSKLEIKEGQGLLGPLKVSYGGGYFNLNAAMDLIETPDLVQITGGTGGWDFGRILSELGVDMQASGTLTAKYNLTGNRHSAKRFLNSMYGSVTVSMVGGRIATSLLELAGLGVFPWLFSSELQKGYTDIVCVVAPLKISGGKVTTGQTVVETRSVQLVAGGELNWRRNTIAFRAEPRPVGKPLNRSAWPFNVTGKLNAPDFQLQPGSAGRKKGAGRVQVRADRKPCVPDVLQTVPRSERN